MSYPPHIPHINNSINGFTNIHIHMVDPELSVEKPFLLKDDENKLILQAFNGSFYIFHSDQTNRWKLLDAYGQLISAHLGSLFTPSAYTEIVVKIRMAILDNYSDPEFALDEFLHKLPYSYDYIRKLFKKQTHQTPHQFLTSTRLQSAVRFIRTISKTDLNISEIALLCGFSNPLYFSRLFKKTYHYSPREVCAYFSKPSDSLTADDFKINM